MTTSEPSCGTVKLFSRLDLQNDVFDQNLQQKSFESYEKSTDSLSFEIVWRNNLFIVMFLLVHRIHGVCRSAAICRSWGGCGWRGRLDTIGIITLIYSEVKCSIYKWAVHTVPLPPTRHTVSSRHCRQKYIY